METLMNNGNQRSQSAKRYLDINSPIDEYHNTLLHLSVAHGDADMVAILLLKGARPNVTNNSGATPLHFARLLRDSKIIQILKLHGALDMHDLHYEEEPSGLTDGAGITATDTAAISAMSKSTTQVSLNSSFQDQIIASRKSTTSDGRPIFDEPRYTGADLANGAYLGLQCVLGAVKPGALDTPDANGATALMKAAYKNHLGLVRLLLEHGADATVVDSTGNTAFHWACLGDAVPVVELLVSFLQQSAPKVLKEMLNYSSYGAPPIIIAAWIGNVDLIQILLDAGSSVNQVTTFGVSALMVATWMGNDTSVRLLLEKGARIRQDVKQWVEKGLKAVLDTGSTQDLSTVTCSKLAGGKTTLDLAQDLVDCLSKAAGEMKTQGYDFAKQGSALKEIWGARIAAQRTDQNKAPTLDMAKVLQLEVKRSVTIIALTIKGTIERKL
jgi:ankyrin repeat protein